MHFVGMLAFSLPLPMAYDPGLTALSLGTAVLGTSLGFAVAGRRGGRRRDAALGGVLTGTAIAAMHYTGMAAMRMPADPRYDGPLVAASVLIAIGAATVALWLAHRDTTPAERLAAAVAMGLAVAGMHYTGMAAVAWAPHAGASDGAAHGQASLGQAGLALGVAGATFLILVLALAAALFDRRFAALARREAELALRASEARLRLVAEAGGVGIWDWDPATDTTTWSEALNRLYGLPPDAPAPRWEEWLARIHPEDRAHADARAYAGLASGTYVDEYRIVRPGGEVRWLAARGLALRDATGRPTRFLGVSIDVTEQRRSGEALRASEARLRSVVETAVDGVLVAGADGRIVAANPAALRMFGYAAAEELIGRNLSVLMPATEGERHDAYLAAHRASGRSRAIGVPGRELVGRRGDGTEFPIDLSVASFLAEGQRFFTGVVRDATERVQAERRREVLVAELNHRVKNTLATVQSVAVQTLRGAGGDVARFAHDFGSRLKALAAAHDLLTAHSWGETDLAAVARAGLAPWTGGGGQRIALEGPEDAVPLRPLQAQAVVLALHELATNAVKHGALSRAGGRVELRWSGRRPDGSAAVEWAETGGPQVAGPPARCGFGTRLLERAVAQDLGPGAKVELRFESRGLRAFIHFFPPPPAAPAAGARRTEAEDAAKDAVARG
jgi:PAS domain S-box-containing protein